MSARYPPPPTHCKLRTYVSLLSACAAVWSLGILGQGAAYAQILPPNDAIQWRTAGDGLWKTEVNWDPVIVPGINEGQLEDVLFGVIPTWNPSAPPFVTVTNDKFPLKLRSIWFDAFSNISYTIRSYAPLRLGVDLPNNGSLITVVSDGYKFVTENNLEAEIILHKTEIARSFWIRNDSLGGLRLGGTLDIGAQNLFVSNTGSLTGGSSAVHLHTDIAGTGNISTVNGYAQHLVLQGDNKKWSGTLNVGAGTLVFVKQNWALGTGANRVSNGGTLGFRSHVGDALEYTHEDVEEIQVTGEGAIRAWGQPAVGAIYHDGGGAPDKLNTFDGDIAMRGSTWFGARGDAGGLTLNGQINGAGYMFTKVGPGLISLTNANNTWESTELRGGALRIAQKGVLPDAVLLLNGGILELAEDDFARGLGSETGQVFWVSSGGFSAYGGNRSVSIILNDKGDLDPLKWDSGGFVGSDQALLLSSRYADSVIDFKNSINLNRGTREIRVERGAPSAYAVISGEIIGTSGLSDSILKTGPGMLWLQRRSFYTGPTLIQEGALRGNIPSASGIQLRGGVLGLDTNFTRSIGTGSGGILWAGNGGGFAAYGANRTVRLDNSTASIDWNAFVGQGRVLRFGHYTANATVIWDKELNLAFANPYLNRTIHIERGSSPNIADVVFNRPMSGTGGQLTIQGNGRMDIIADNPKLGLSQLNIYGTELRLHGEGRIAAATNTWVNIYNGGTLTLDNIVTYNSDRINNESTIGLGSGGTLRYRGRLSRNSQEQVGTIWLTEGVTTIELLHIASGVGDFTELRGSHLVGGLLNYITNTEDFSKVRLSFTNWDESGNLTFNDGGGTKITPWGTVNGKDWITPVENGSVTELRPVTNYDTGPQDTWDTAHNIFQTSTQTLSESRTINSLKLGDITLNTGTHTLTINSGGLLSTTGNPVISGSGSITKLDDSKPFYAHIYSPTLTISGSVGLDTILGNSFYKTGPGTLVLDSTSSHVFPLLYIYQGTVQLDRGRINVSRLHIGDWAGRDVLILPANSIDPLYATGLSSAGVTLWLRGTTYGLDPSNVYGGEQSDGAILRLSGNTKQTLGTLRVGGLGIIDFAGGEVGKANMLFVGEFQFDTDDSRLFIRNWYQYEDYLLVRKQDPFNGFFNPAHLSRIIFDGYQDFPVLAVDYDNLYYMITPFNAPEPTTYGLIFAAMGLGLAAWRRKRQRQNKKETH